MADNIPVSKKQINLIQEGLIAETGAGGNTYNMEKVFRRILTKSSHYHNRSYHIETQKAK